MVNVDIVLDVISGVSCIGAIAMAYWGYRKWDVARKERKAEFLWRLLEKLREDEAIQRFEYAVDYGKDVAKIEEGLKDRVLSYMAYICYLNETGVVSDYEFSFFEYEITRAINNPKIKEYLDFIKGFSRRNNCRDPFVALNEYITRKARNENCP